MHHFDDNGFRGKRETNTFLPLRMEVYFDSIDDSSSNLPILQDLEGGFLRAVTYLESVLSVVRNSGNLIIPPTCTAESDGQCTDYEIPNCGPHATVPNEHLGTITVCDPTCREVGGAGVGVDTDYILYVTAVNESELKMMLEPSSIINMYAFPCR